MARAKVAADVKIAFFVAVGLIATAALVDSEPVSWMLAALFVPMLLYATARAPMRHSLMVLMFCGFVLENPSEAPAMFRWESPFHKVGAGMLAHLNNLAGISWLSFSGQDVVIGVLILVALYRRYSGSTTDRRGRYPAPKIMRTLCYVSLLVIVYSLVIGLLRGGQFNLAIWQIEKVVHLPVLFLLFDTALRGPQDLVALAKVVVASAVLRAYQAYHVVSVVVQAGEDDMHYATTHHDSMLFAAAFVILLISVLERVGKKATRAAIFCIPILIVGMVVNNRRMVWVQVAMVMLTLYFATPESRFKKKIRKFGYWISPLAAVYFVVGWSSKASFFALAQTLRSIVEPSTDPSSLWREIENYDLLYTIKQYPVFGYGYGLPFIEAIPLPQVDYPLEYILPHNSILGLWAFTGIVGFTGTTLLWGSGVFFAMRAYYAASEPTHRVAAIVAVGSVIIYMVQCFGDMGLGTWTGIYLVTPALVCAGKLAVANGAWGKSAVKAEKPAPEVTNRTAA